MMNRQQHGGLLTALVALAALAAGASATLAGEIRVWPSGVATGDVVTLANVADLRGFDLATKQRLGEIVVHAAPRPGGGVLVHIDDVRGALAEADANLATTRIFGSARCKVTRPRPRPRPQTVPRKARTRTPPEPVTAEKPASGGTGPKARTLESVLREYISARLPGPDTKLEVRFSPASERALRLDARDHRFKIRPANDRRLGFISFEVEVTSDGGEPRTEAVVAEVEVVKDVVIARRPINRGRTIEGRDLKLEARRFTDLESVGITTLAAAIGQQSEHFVHAGEMLVPGQLKAKPLVHRGERVIIWVQHGGVRINTSGRAQQPGALGEIIEVRRDGAKRKQDLIEVVVTGPGTVAVSGARQLASR